MNIPHVSAWNIYSNFSDGSLKCLEHAVSKVVKEYPLLNGILVRPESKGSGGEPVVIYPSERPSKKIFRVVECSDVEAPELFKSLDASPTTSEQWETTQKAAREELEPVVQKYSLQPPAMDESTPLFQVVVGKLPDNRAWVMIEVAHVLGDGASFYSITEAINNAMHDIELPDLEFAVAEENVAYSKHKSEQDKYNTLLGWLSASIEALNTRKQVITTCTVRKDVAKTCKIVQAAKSNVPFLSTNDILMASFAEIYKDHEVMCMLVNMRGREASAKINYIVNYERTVMFPSKCLLDNSAFVREKILGKNSKHSYEFYGTDEFPDLSKELFGSVTNWAGLTKMLYPPGATLDMHLPNSAFLAGMGIDFFIIWNPIEGVTSIMTNMCEESLQKNAKESDLFKNIFGM